MSFYFQTFLTRPLSFLSKQGRCNGYTQWFQTVPKTSLTQTFPTRVSTWNRTVLWPRLWLGKCIFNLYVQIMTNVLSPTFPLSVFFFFLPQQSVHIETRHSLSPQRFTYRRVGCALLQPSSCSDKADANFMYRHSKNTALGGLKQ